MRITALPGLPVVDTHVARQAGVVSDVLLDVARGRLACVNVKHGDGWLVQRIPAEFVHRAGPQTVLVADSVAVDMAPPAASRGWFRVEALIGLEVMSEGGDRVGEIADADIDSNSLEVTAYVLRKPTGRWPNRRGRIMQSEVVSVSPEMMIVRELSSKSRDDRVRAGAVK